MNVRMCMYVMTDSYLSFFQGQKGWRVLQTGQGESFLQCETQTCSWNRTYTSCRPLFTATVWSQLWFSLKILFLTNTFQGVEETTLAPPVTCLDDCQTVLPAVNNSDPFVSFHRKRSWAKRFEAENGKWSSPTLLHKHCLNNLTMTRQ